MKSTTSDIDRAIDYILCIEKSNSTEIKRSRGRQKKDTPPIWALEFFDPEKNRTFALISMCIKENYNQSIGDLAQKLSVLKSRPLGECLSVLRSLAKCGKLGYYDSNLIFRLWSGKETVNGLESLCG
ncbi:MAG: hypothetical protein IJO09_06110 [Oscillospiraceae bacterium]|nr:hypothetical protein [Oscillospiraceae bacterium]